VAHTSQTPVWVDVLTAFATLGAVLVALYVSVVRERLRAPRLSLSLTSEAQIQYMFASDEASTSGVITLAVRNAPRTRTAESVQVLLTVWPPGTRPIYRFINQRRLQWWYGDERLGRADAVTTETLGPGVTRHIALAMIGHPRPVHDAIFGSAAWPQVEDHPFWREHRHGIWAISPLDTEGSGWFKVDQTLNIALTITARDVDARTYYSQVTLRLASFGPQHPNLRVLGAEYAVFSRHPGTQRQLSIRDASRCTNPEGCSARNWPWATRCWRCGWGLLD
jgi:hypothetical protein